MTGPLTLSTKNKSLKLVTKDKVLSQLKAKNSPQEWDTVIQT